MDEVPVFFNGDVSCRHIICHGTHALIQLLISQLDRGMGKFADVIR